MENEESRGPRTLVDLRAQVAVSPSLHEVHIILHSNTEVEYKL